MDKVYINDQGMYKKIIIISLIVIVVMFLIIVGGTFAYLSNSIENKEKTDANTNAINSDLLYIEAGEEVNIIANTENFISEGNDLTQVIYSSVTFQTMNTETSTYNYDVYLLLPTNEFDYTSGGCYNKTMTLDYDNYDLCINNGGYFARISGSNEYACYNASEANYINNNSTLCTLSDANMWVMDKVPELTIDIFKTSNDNKTVCETAGKCVNTKTRDIINIEKASCNESLGYTWINNEYEKDTCYVLDQSHDITKTITSGTHKYSIYSKESISATSTSASINNYRFVVTLHNLGHNQIENGNKKMNGTLQFKVLSEN